MTNQYKKRQSSLTDEINSLRKELSDKDEEIEKLNLRIENMKRDHQQALDEKDLENKTLKKKIEEMSSEFSTMLKVLSYLNPRQLSIRCRLELTWHSGRLMMIRLS